MSTQPHDRVVASEVGGKGAGENLYQREHTEKLSKDTKESLLKESTETKEALRQLGEEEQAAIDADIDKFLVGWNQPGTAPEQMETEPIERAATFTSVPSVTLNDVPDDVERFVISQATFLMGNLRSEVTQLAQLAPSTLPGGPKEVERLIYQALGQMTAMMRASDGDIGAKKVPPRGTTRGDQAPLAPLNENVAYSIDNEGGSSVVEIGGEVE